MIRIANVGLVSLISEDLDADGGAGENGGVLAAVKQRLAHQVVHDCPEPALGPYCCLGSPSQVILAAGQQVGDVGGAGQRRGVLSVITRSCRLAASCQGRVEVIG